MKYTSIEDWARAIGSKAKTRAGQHKAILASFTSTYGSGLKGSPAYRVHHTMNSKEAYLNNRTRQRQERFAANHPLTLAYPPPATEADVEGKWARKTDVLSLKPNDRCFARVGEWHIRVTENADYEYCYSKSYGHPKKTVTGRTVLIRRVAENGALESRDIEVESFRGNYVLDAVLKAGITPTQEGLKSVRLHDAYNAMLVRKGRSIKIYERTLAGVCIDYCAVAHSTTFHAETEKDALRGLRTKIRNINLRAKGGLIDFSFCKKLGFCDIGINQFATTFGFDTKRAYTAEEVANRVKANLTDAIPFRSELNTLAKAVNYKVTF